MSDGTGAIAAHKFSETSNESVVSEAFNGSPLRNAAGRVEVTVGTTDRIVGGKLLTGLMVWDVTFLDYAGKLPNLLSCSATDNGVTVEQHTEVRRVTNSTSNHSYPRSLAYA